MHGQHKDYKFLNYFDEQFKQSESELKVANINSLLLRQFAVVSNNLNFVLLDFYS